MRTIVVRRTTSCWIADCGDTDDAENIRQLFGTTTLPLPFTPDAPLSLVRSTIQAQNPGYQIREESMSCRATKSLK